MPRSDGAGGRGGRNESAGIAPAADRSLPFLEGGYVLSDGADVIQLHDPARDREQPTTAKPRDPRRPAPKKCKHPRTEVDPNHRHVVCRDCGELVDAFEALVAIADNWDRLREIRDGADREARLAQKRLDDIRLDERRTKNRLRSMKAQERTLENRLARLDAELRSFTPTKPTNQESCP